MKICCLLIVILKIYINYHNKFFNYFSSSVKKMFCCNSGIIGIKTNNLPNKVTKMNHVCFNNKICKKLPLSIVMFCYHYISHDKLKKEKIRLKKEIKILKKNKNLKKIYFSSNSQYNSLYNEIYKNFNYSIECELLN